MRWIPFAALLLLAGAARGQDNYEIQVYGSETVAPGMTMVEVHSNVTARGEQHAVRETLELTHGFNDWFETGFYPSIDLNVSPDWEFNAGVGFGLTRATDRVIVKFIVGRRMH